MSQDGYARSAARVAAAQLAEAAGFDAVQTSSLDLLSDLLLRYISEVGSASHAYAELANRAGANALDVVQALNDVGVSLTDLKEFAKKQADVPFAQTIAPFPQAKKTSPPPTFAERSEAPPHHIPDFLPALPDLHAYSKEPRYPQAERNINERQQRLTEQQESGEKALIKLQARLDPANEMLAAAAKEKQPEPGAGVEAEQDAAQNPFLGPVLWEEEAAAAQAGEVAGVPPAAPSAPSESAETAPWTSLGEPLPGQPEFPKPFADWQWTGRLMKASLLASSGRSRQGDAYGTGKATSDEDPKLARAAEILAARGDEGEGGYAEPMDVEMGLGREQI